uniref:Uncharacterized protein n=1 Tax=Manihot esculenta TaxID=3983 RepID=A0A2C9VK10_MANES
MHLLTRPQLLPFHLLTYQEPLSRLDFSLLLTPSYGINV